MHEKKLTRLNAILQRLLAIAENLFQVSWRFRDLQAMVEDFFEIVRVIEVEHLARSIVYSTNVIDKNIDHFRQELDTLERSTMSWKQL